MRELNKARSLPEAKDKVASQLGQGNYCLIGASQRLFFGNNSLTLRDLEGPTLLGLHEVPFYGTLEASLRTPLIGVPYGLL